MVFIVTIRKERVKLCTVSLNIIVFQEDNAIISNSGNDQSYMTVKRIKNGIYQHSVPKMIIQKWNRSGILMTRIGPNR